MTRRRRAVLLFVLGLAFSPVLVFAIERLTFRPGFNLYSPKVDVELGKRNADQADKELPLITDSRVVDYVNNLGKSLVKNEPLPVDYPWTFKVVNSREINAFAFPGGYIYVNRGAIEAADAAWPAWRAPSPSSNL